MLREGGKTVNSRSDVPSDPASGDPRWHLVLRIAESQRFAKSLRLRDFLVYVCRAALDGRLDDIHEQKIGERVFNRPHDYNSNEDNIVRSHARLLRQKLEAYFSTEGASEPLILRIPKGGYVPEFVEKPVEPAPSTPKRDRLIPILASAVGILSLTVALQSWMMFRSRANNPAPVPAPAVAALWSQLFSEHMLTTIVIPDDTFGMLHEAAGETQNLESYLRRAAPDSALPKLLPNFSLRRYTTYDGITAVVRVLQISKMFAGRVVVRYARDVALRDLSPGNVVLIGRPAENPWAELFQSKLHFHIDFDAGRRSVICRNASPQPGEQAEYVARPDDSPYEAYSAVGLVPNLNGGNVLSIRGSASSSQEGAAEFATSEKFLAALTSRIAAGRSRLPYFDVLLRNTTVDGLSQDPSMIAYRVLDGSRGE